jgi:hypothetical protein
MKKIFAYKESPGNTMSPANLHKIKIKYAKLTLLKKRINSPVFGKKIPKKSKKRLRLIICNKGILVKKFQFTSYSCTMSLIDSTISKEYPAKGRKKSGKINDACFNS